MDIKFTFSKNVTVDSAKLNEKIKLAQETGQQQVLLIDRGTHILITADKMTLVAGGVESKAKRIANADTYQ